MKKPTKKERLRLRTNRAFEVAAETMLFLNVEKRAVTVRLGTKLDAFVPSYTPSDFRQFVLNTIGMLAACLMRDNREVESDDIYEELLSMPDPHCFLDKVSEDEVRNMVTLALYLLTANWFAVEAIAAKLLAYPEKQPAVISFLPSEYSLVSK